MRNVFNFAASLGDGPVFLCGDFQSSLSQNAAIAEALRTGEWTDLVAEDFAARSLPSPHTFVRGKGKKMRASCIDFVLAYADGATFFESSWHHRTSGLPDHIPVGVRCKIPCHKEFAFSLAHQPKWQFPSKPHTPEEWGQRSAIYEHVLSPFLERLAESASQLRVDETWQVACDAVTAMLNTIANQQLQSKGNVPDFQLTPVVHEPKEVSLKTRRIAKIHSLFQEMKRKVFLFDNNRSFAWKQSFCNSQNKLRDLLGVVQYPHTLNFLVDRSLISADYEQFQGWVQARDNKIKYSSLARWKRKLRISNNADKRIVHRWLKGQFTSTPRLFKRDDGTVSGSISEMLQAVSDQMETVYTTHANWDINAQTRFFREKYATAIQQVHVTTDLPSLTEFDLWHTCQTKSSSKASGLDTWSYHDLLQLPPVGWKPFLLVCKLAEATQQWPAPLRLVSVTCIPKSEGNILDPKSIRAIGVSSVVYSIWASTRFKHLTPWLQAFAPPSLLGGIPGRSRDASAIDLSLEFQENQDDRSHDPIGIFIDRTKCFDMIVSDFAIQIAEDIGPPCQVARALKGFYANQLKFFKVGRFYGRSVQLFNSAVQGCSMSIILVNALYAIMTRAVSSSFTQVSVATFIDDAKIWGSFDFVDQLAQFFEAIKQFDVDIGQSIHPEKTQILCRRTKKGRHLKRKLSIPLPVTHQVKSLGRSQQMNRQRNSKFQKQRVSEAIGYWCLEKKRLAPLIFFP